MYTLLYNHRVLSGPDGPEFFCIVIISTTEFVGFILFRTLSTKVIVVLSELSIVFQERIIFLQ
jgi:hypothetical protein